MKAIKGSEEAKKLMEQVRSHKKPAERRSINRIINDNLTPKDKET